MNETPIQAPLLDPAPARPQKHQGQRANQLDGAQWLQHSISIWSDLRKNPEELALRHPASFPMRLAARLIACFSNADQQVVLDPFAGVGTTLIAAEQAGKLGIGIELSPEYAQIASQRSLTLGLFDDPNHQGGRIVHQADAAHLLEYVNPQSVDLVITSPPYWDVLLQKRSADGQATKHYGDAEQDLGKIADYHQFLDQLTQVFAQVLVTLKPKAYCCVVVMDLRKGDTFYPFHADLATKLQEIGYTYDDLILWDRRAEYSNMRPLGYPSVFRINKAHEYILIFQKPPENTKETK